MGQKELLAVLNFIVHQASDRDIDAIMQAIQKRSQQKGGGAANGLNFGKMSQNVASQIQNQLSMPKENIRKMVREMVVKMIKQQVPDIPDEHLEVLLNEWAPEPPAPPSSVPDMHQGFVDMRIEPSQNKALVKGEPLPPDILLTMIKHFIEYNTQSLAPESIQMLEKAMPKWNEEYWKNFPDPVKELINLYLNGEIELTMLWQQVKAMVGVRDDA